MASTADRLQVVPRCLVDTHVWLWAHTDRRRLPDDVLRFLYDPSREVLLSAASVWEIAIKYRLGKLPLPQPPELFVPDRMKRSGTTALLIRPEHALAAGALPDHHRDPFDRMLIAQASSLGAPLISADRRLSAYDVQIIAV